MRLQDISVQMHLISNGDGVDLHAIGCDEMLRYDTSKGAWQAASDFLKKNAHRYVFSAFSYELKDDIEDLSSSKPAFIPFPSLVLFTAGMVYRRHGDTLEIVESSQSALDSDALRSELMTLLNPEQQHTVGAVDLEHAGREKYIEHVSILLENIQLGDIYEANYCQEFRCSVDTLDPWLAFAELNEATQAPYACHLRIDNLHLLCGSPELYLEKEEEVIRCRPIKGTRKRSQDPEADCQLIHELETDRKERAENIMITDLVRNDLSRHAASGSVEVTELCKVYSYETVHQMISTVECRLKESSQAIDIIRDSFPMGSMTGAPKIRAMELIEGLEMFRRGIYSGSVGYFAPHGDFTLNVVIRSILYDAASKRASVAAGGAITALADAADEYEESLLKAEAMLAVLGVNHSTTGKLT